MRPLFLLVALLALTACVPQAVTPVFVVQYPATWTPAPTPTNTPPGPTATHVIQRTPGPLATLLPNMRILPQAARGTVMLWLTVTADTPKATIDLTPLAPVIITNGTGRYVRRRSTFAFLETSLSEVPAAANVPPQYAGVLLSDAASLPFAELGNLRTRLGPRLLIAAVPMTATASIETMLENTDGIRFDDFMRMAGDPLNQFMDEVAWKQQVDLLAEATAHTDKVVLTRTKLPSRAENANVSPRQWLSYAAASFLLGVGNAHSFFGFEDETSQGALTLLTGRYALGLPQGAMFKANGVYQRRFARGLVVVNPTEEPHSFQLPRSYLNVDDNPITLLTLPPHTAQILKSVE